MPLFRVLGRVIAVGLLTASGAPGRAVAAQRPATPRGTPAASSHSALDTAAILASARPEIEAANRAWLPGLRHKDAASIAAAYSDSGIFIGPDGSVARGREGVAKMYAARFPRMGTILGGSIVQEGVAIAAANRIYEWGHGWLELPPATPQSPPRRSGGAYLTVWQREPDGHWRIVRNMSL